jgi:glucose-1-phosphate thymidylyltransferase
VKLIVLAAGYATRLYPLTLDRPKPLLSVGGRPMIEHVLEKLAPIPEIDNIYVVTNAKFAAQFRDWASSYGGDLTIVDDGSTSEDDRLGAIGDLHLVLTREGIEDDVVVVAGDNLFSESLEEFGRFARKQHAPVVGVYDVGDRELIRKYSSVEIGDDGRIAFFEEKPEQPRSTLTAIALYHYPQVALPLVDCYVGEGNDRDQPGRLIEWLHTRTPVYAWRVPGAWFDIGSKEQLEEADRVFSARASSARS